MPEITAVQYMTDNLRIWLSGRTIKAVHFSASTNHKRIHLGDLLLPTEACSPPWRRGKHSIIPIGKGAIVLSYNLSAKVLRTTKYEPKNSRLVFELDNSEFIAWKDRINLGEIRWFPDRGHKDNTLHTFFDQVKNLGPEFWPQLRDGQWWQSILENRKARLYTLLLNQSVVAGIGNIIALETMHKLGLSLNVRPNELSLAQWGEFSTAIRTVVDASMYHHNSLRITEQKSSDPFRGELLFVSEGHTVAKGFTIYGRSGEKCRNCTDGIIIKSRIQGRPTYACNHCQAPT
jgi:formamidopyrimidine-DNA glycosylase